MAKKLVKTNVCLVVKFLARRFFFSLMLIIEATTTETKKKPLLPEFFNFLSAKNVRILQPV